MQISKIFIGENYLNSQFYTVMLKIADILSGILTFMALCPTI